MIYDTIKSFEENKLYDDKTKLVLDYVKSHDISKLEVGSHQIDGNNFYVNVLSYDTENAENRSWESHDKYIDVHVLASGIEGLALNDTSNMQRLEYNIKKDKATLTGSENVTLSLRPDEILICYPEDGHKTGIQVTEQPSHLKKCVFKVKL
ncbi:YhcH/YjgK/YiaL family protein [Levilactobacillus angrenensis]|uniref:YhcH/YjgK/YiaL family protein n=1 Tax=Levilactobacillus angrenensis TaxID=2486020 RepID=A0ABW1U551_9LACO|nr:YhcH/YjgK/YiaL family protein [Levilactobacillus angrenensis]